MTDFRTKVPVPDFPFKTDHTDAVFCMGSCFSEHIGQRLADNQFEVLVNPFGIIYNPFSVAGHLLRSMARHPYTTDELFQHQGLWHHFQVHSRLSGPNRIEVVDQLNEKLQSCAAFLQKANLVILTLGTSRIFVHDDQIVANCHKLPATHFSRGMSTVDNCLEIFESVLDQLQSFNPNANIVFTVSPVRHLRDGAIANQRSKATLLLVVDQLVQDYEKVHYFPAYEMMMDDLRDYRFYASDMVHPNDMAIDYIWSGFARAALSDNAKRLLPTIGNIRRAALHRPFHPRSEEHQAFLRKQLNDITQLQRQYPFLVFENEKKLLEQQLI